MRITIEHAGRMVIVEKKDAEVIDEVFELFKDALCGIGFAPENVQKLGGEKL